MSFSSNPISGHHSSGYRFKFSVPAISPRPLFLPLEMKAIPQIRQLLDGVSPSVAFNTTSLDDALDAFHRLRLAYDFDYWAANEYRIQDINDPDRIVTLRLNACQLYVIDIFRRRFFNRLNGRYIITKSFHGCGLSTCIQAYILWMQSFRCRNNSYTCSTSDIALSPLKANLCRYLHSDVVSPDPAIFLPRVDGHAFFYTFRNPDAIRGINLGYVHFADMSKWNDPDHKLAPRAFKAAFGAVLLDYFTIIVLEGNTPKENHFSLPRNLHTLHMETTDIRMKRLSAVSRNPFFLNEVIKANKDNQTPHFFHINLDKVPNI